MRISRRFHPVQVEPVDPVKVAIQNGRNLAAKGQIEEAIDLLSAQLLKTPTSTDLLTEIARILVEVERLQEAIGVLQVLQAHLPRSGEVAKMLGTVAGRMRNFPMAIEQLTIATAIFPNDTEVLISLAMAHQELGDLEDTAKCIQRAVQLKPDDITLRCYSAFLFSYPGLMGEAENLLTDPLPEVRFLKALLFPIVADSAEEIEEDRSHCAEVMHELASEGKTFSDPEKKINVTTFQLGYHGKEDRELVELISQTYLKVCPELDYTSKSIRREPVGNRKLKVGFVSSNMRNHSAGRVIKRFLQELDRTRFEVTLFELPGKFDGGQETARAMADRTVFLPLNLEKARRSIERAKQDILLYPDAVLDANADRLAYSRLAPVQCSTWGHPGTYGRPTMDYWVSCDDWEPEGNERMYTEKLVRLSQPPMIMDRRTVPDSISTRSELGLPEGTIYACPQSIYKIHPGFDSVLAQVLERDPTARLAIIGGSQRIWADRFKNRFFSRYGHVKDRVVILPLLDTDDYFSLLAHCAVSLDPFYFGGAMTSVDSFLMGLPVVTLPGDQLRCRVTYSFYRMMGISELIVGSVEEYVDLSIRIAHDPELRQHLSSLVRDRCHVLFDTVGVTRELETFFEEAAKAAIGS